MDISVLLVALMICMTVAQPQMPRNPNQRPVLPPGQGRPSNPLPGNQGPPQGMRPPGNLLMPPQGMPPQGVPPPQLQIVSSIGAGPAGGAVQAPGNPNNQATCTSAGREAILRCYQTNGGYTMQNVLALLSDGTQFPLPRNAAEIKSGICRNQGSIIACVFTGINGLRGSPQCGNPQEFVRMEQETVGLVAGMQQMCGKGPLPAPDVCHRDLEANLKQCYTKQGLSSDLFTPNSTTVFRSSGSSELIGAIIGNDAKKAEKFCSVRTRLFDCMKQTIERCPGAMEILALSGFEQEAMQKGIDVLCNDVRVYIDGLRCFQNPSAEVRKCYTNLVSKLTELSAEQLRQTMPTNQYYNRYCQLRIQHMECDMAAWGKQCTKKSVGLKNEFECNLLPSTCKTDPTVQSKLQQTCAVAKYERQLRSGASGRLTLTSLAMTVLSVILAAIVF